MKLLSLDLEMNQPSNKIIQVGACVGDITTGEVLEKLSVDVKIDEPITLYIENLTGISNERMNAGTTLKDAYNSLIKLAEKHSCPRGMTLTWGVGDLHLLRSQLGYDEDWYLGRRFMDVKTLYIFYALSNNKPIRGGLAKSLLRLGLKFEGTKHDAQDDAVNTFRVAHELFKRLQTN
jgi:inhibitor of KinA sporulation pathway (predicted exonuclease)